MVIGACPELEQKGMWRSFGLSRELDALAAAGYPGLSFGDPQQTEPAQRETTGRTS